MTERRPTRVLLRARTPVEAQVVLALLRAEGIAAYVNGGALTDEFAVSQRLMRLQGAEIEVGEQDFDQAQRVLKEARDQRDLSSEPVEFAEPAGPAEPPGSAPRGRGLAILLAVVGLVLAALFLALWLDARRELNAMQTVRAHSLTRSEIVADGWCSISRESGRVVTKYLDQNHNGIAEQTTHFDDAGAKTSIAYDVDEDGHSERSEYFAPDGHLISDRIDADEDGRAESSTSHHADGSITHYAYDGKDGLLSRMERQTADGRAVSESADEDQDGTFETSTSHYPDGSWSVWRDTDQDGLWDRCEVHDAQGALVRTLVQRGAQGFVDEK